MEGPEVLHCKLLLEAGDDVTQEPRGGGGEHNIVNVEEVRSVRAATEEEQGRVRLGFDEALRTQEGGEATVPRPGGCLRP